MNGQSDLSTFEVEISPNDKRKYRGLVLKNGLKVVLVQDQDAKKAAASMDVNVGQFSDPYEVPGLAHFCEHMLFLGTEKFPNENEYSQYLSKHGGFSNAFTDKENTNYHFTVSAENFEGALDRFAQFFISPLFTASATDREMNAVDSENSKNLQVDTWRAYQLLRTTSDPSHSFAKFGTGNIQTLKTEPESKGIDTRSMLLKFHDEYYSANQMGLVIIGPQPLDILQEWANRYFVPIVDKNLAPPQQSGSAFGSKQLRLRRKIVPINESNKVVIYFPLRSYMAAYREKPLSYLSNLLGHESEGSILHVLKECGWANELAAGASHSNRDFELFSIQVDLTIDGLEHVNDVIDYVFQYIDMLKYEGPSKRQYDEIASVQAMAFRFQEPSKPLNYATHLACNLHKRSPNEVISGSYLMRKWCPELIEEILQSMTPENSFIHQFSQSYADVATEREKWYGTAFYEEPISSETITSWHHKKSEISAQIHLPLPNEFIAENFEIYPQESEENCSNDSNEIVSPEPVTTLSVPGGIPQLLIQNEGLRLWHHQDSTFLVPKATINVRLLSTVVVESPRNFVLSEIFSRVVTEAMNTYSYFAEIAGLSYSIHGDKSGLIMNFRGYNDKLPQFAIRMIDELRKYAKCHQSSKDIAVFNRVKVCAPYRLIQVKPRNVLILLLSQVKCFNAA